jgi:hypothetical protein
VNRERAESYLRLQVESELRRAAAAQPGDSDVAADCTARLMRVAQVLTAVHALGDEVADQVLDDFELALDFQRPGSAGQRSSMRPPLSARRHPGRNLPLLMHAPPSAAPARTAPDRVVPVGQTVAVRSEDFNGEIVILSYAHTAAGARFTIFVRRGSRLGVPPAMLPFHQFTATDERGTRYRMGTHGPGVDPHDGTLRLHPDPPHDLRWLDLTATPGEPSVRIDLTRPPDATDVTVSEAASSPGEHLLDDIAMRLLAAAPAFPRDMRLHPAGLRLAIVVDGLGDVIAALQACGALSPHSPVLGQFAALCANLGVTGHGITAPRDYGLPERWRSVLMQHYRRATQAAPEGDGCATATVAFPGLDGIRLAILGLHYCGDDTVLHATWHGGHGPGGLAPAIWIRDSGGSWHATRDAGGEGECVTSGDVTARLNVVPPLSDAATWIEVLAAGQSADARAVLPVRWQ